MLDSIGGRKALVSFVVLLVGVGVTLYTGDVPDGLLQLLSIIFGGFIVGNVGEHISGAVVSKAEVLAGVGLAEPPAVSAEVVAPPPAASDYSGDFSYLGQRLDELDKKLAQGADATNAVGSALTMIIKKYKMDE